MSMYNTCLQNFVEAVPSCTQADRLSVVLEIFRRGEHDRVVVVNHRQSPVGLIHLHSVLPYVFSASALNRVATLDPQQPLSELAPSILEPLVCLPASFTLQQFWDTLQPLRSPIALVDPFKQFLGLLNSRQLLQFLKTPANANSTSAGHSFVGATHSDGAPIADHRQSVSPPRPLIQLLEQLPLPLMLQTSSGQVLAQNSAWNKQVGELLDPAWVGRDAAAQLSHQAQAASNSKLDSVTARQFFAEPAPSSLCQIGTEPNTCVCLCPMKNGQERSLQFVKIPLGKTLPGVPSSAPSGGSVDRARADGSSDSYSEMDSTHFQLAALAAVEREQGRHYSFRAIAPPPAVSNAANPVRSAESALNSAAEETLWLVLAQDVTEQQQLARELTAKNADLVQLNRLKDEFLACISHELKTPLTAVLGLSNLLKDQAVGDLNDRQLRYAQLIYQSGRHLMMVVNDILDLTRMETGQLELMLEPVNISVLCDRVIEQSLQLRTLEDKPETRKDDSDMPSTTAPFALEIEPQLDDLIADELRLRQMLVNLLSNAFKFTEAGGDVGLKVSRWAGWIAFTVWDTGIGIPADKQHLIFQKFQQLENPLTRRFEGTGLGLVLTQRLARLHGGDITFTSKEGAGSQFTLLLPPKPPQKEIISQERVRLGASVPAIVEPAKPIQHRVAKPNSLVLVVEAVPRYVEHLTEQLTELGYLVVIARSGTEALEKARKLQPCAIFLNPLLPLLSGWDVLTLLKSDLETRHIPTIVTASRVEKEQAYRNHADGFLNLPIRVRELQKVLERLTNEPTVPQVSERPATNLAILRLQVGGHVEVENEFGKASDSATIPDLNSLLHSHHYRVLEADDLEQAELLARVWKPKAVLLDGSLSEPLGYLRQLHQHAFLASLPIVTLDQRMTEAANQVEGLSVFPCLVEFAADAASGNSSSALLQVLQVATGFAWNPLILAVDTALLPDLIESADIEGGTDLFWKGSNLSDRFSSNHIQESIPELQSAAEGSSQQTDWLQALTQYVQTAGYRSAIGRSWTEVLRRLQHHSIDVLLICWHEAQVSSTLVQALSNLKRLPTRPPILIIDCQWQPGDVQANSSLPEPIRDIATQVLPPFLPIPELLEQIKQVLK